MKQKFLFSDSIEFGNSILAEAPETFNSVDVIVLFRELILRMYHSIMFFVTEVNQRIVDHKSVGKHCTLFANHSFYNRHYLAMRTVFYDLCKYFSLSLQNSKYNCFPSGATTSFSALSFWSKITFVQFYFSFFKRTRKLTILGHPKSDSVKNSVHRDPTYSGYFSNFCRVDIHAKKFQYFSELLLRNSGTVNILVLHRKNKGNNYLNLSSPIIN